MVNLTPTAPLQLPILDTWNNEQVYELVGLYSLGCIDAVYSKKNTRANRTTSYDTHSLPETVEWPEDAHEAKFKATHLSCLSHFHYAELSSGAISTSSNQTIISCIGVDSAGGMIEFGFVILVVFVLLAIRIKIFKHIGGGRRGM